MKPLVFDLDRTLSRVDTLLEVAVRLAFLNPLRLLRAVLIAKTRLDLKKSIFELSRHGGIAAAAPLNEKVFELCKKEARLGREIVLATGSLREIADTTADSLGFGVRVLSSTEKNLKGQEKASVLRELYGVGGFDYVGDSSADKFVWDICDKGYFVGSKRKHLRFEKKFQKSLIFIPADARQVQAIAAMRPAHWVKNALLFLAPVLAVDLNVEALVTLLLGFLAFSLVASGLYIFNDVLDMSSDRLHHVKKQRVIASGILDLRLALFLIPLLLLSGLILAFMAATGLGLVLVVFYGVFSVAYSLVIKRIPVLDVIGLSFLYVYRIVAGGLLVGVGISFWLLTFAFLTFLSLALVKRSVELGALNLSASGEMHSMSNRGYEVRDLQWVRPMGIALSATTILVLSLYVEDKFALGDSQNLLPFALIPIWAIWVSRLWFDESHKRVDSDPVRYALSNPMSLALLATMASLYFFLTLLGG